MGKLVFQQNGKDASWNGMIEESPAAADTYIYSITYLNLLSNQTEIISGDITLLR